jgi:hypothetical protein
VSIEVDQRISGDNLGPNKLASLKKNLNHSHKINILERNSPQLEMISLHLMMEKDTTKVLVTLMFPHLKSINSTSNNRITLKKFQESHLKIQTTMKH